MGRMESMNPLAGIARELPEQAGLGNAAEALLQDAAQLRRRLKRGESVYTAGREFEAIYVVHGGFFKTSIVHSDGRSQVAGFHMRGDLLGIDGMATDAYTMDAVALENGEVLVISQAAMERLGMMLQRAICVEVGRAHRMMLLLGTLRAEERFAAFLLHLSHAFLARGYSPHEFNLRMTRHEIGSFLGLKFETVSRLFSRFHDQGLIAVQHKHVRLLDTARLRAIMNGGSSLQLAAEAPKA
jgi:CRP/FNR family transcriptional regulator, anaerobic regulatory protein